MARRINGLSFIVEQEALLSRAGPRFGMGCRLQPRWGRWLGGGDLNRDEAGVPLALDQEQHALLAVLATTWSLVTTWPAASQTKPVPDEAGPEF